MEEMRRCYTESRMEEMRRYYTVSETASLLRCHEETIRRRVRRGEIPVRRVGDGRHSLIRISAEWLENTDERAG